MTLRHTIARVRLACLVAAAAGSITGAAQAQNGIKLSLDERERLDVWFADVLTPWSRFQGTAFAPPKPPSLG